MAAPLTFDNRFVRDLPGDPDPSPERRQVLHACWSHALPTPVSRPTLVAHAHEVASLIGLGEADIQAPEFAAVFGGNALYDGMQPYAACYGGHQFGHWAGQLGDGRAISLGESVNAAGQRWELQLKGAGPTPYSRTADGRAVLRSSIREFLCSEAMYHLGVPTTRALSLVATGDGVLRDMFYDGNVRLEPGAIVCRVAPSFVRFGNFEILTARDDLPLLERLVDFTIDRDFAHLEGEPDARREAWFGEVCERTADMIVHWMRVGFVHGVMNTDNMSILGLTIDYGPYGWLEQYEPDWTPNTTDAGGRRYRFGHQPAVAQWNLVQLATAIAPLFSDTAPLQRGLDRYVARYRERFHRMTHNKFGIIEADDASEAILSEAYDLLEACALDYTNFFRLLGDLPLTLPSEAELSALFEPLSYDVARYDVRRDALMSWVTRWHAMAGGTPEGHAARRTRMHAVNPKYVFRNYLAQQAIDKAEAGDTAMVHELLDLLRRPYDEQPGREHFAAGRPEWARHKAGSSMLSCSS